jgi:predicted TIM-barrel fold metal-dependent hydrolase
VKKSDRERPPRSPIWFGPASNGEFPPTAPMAVAEERVRQIAASCARRLGLSRRQFLAGPCGTAAALMVLNGLSGCRTYRVEKAMLHDEAQARSLLDGREFIVDLQTHHVDAADGAEWVAANPEYRQIFEMVSAQKECGKKGALACLSRDTYIHEVFAASDTAVAVLSGVPSRRPKSPLSNEEIRATRDVVNRLAGSQRLLAQAVVHPHEGTSALEDMHSLVEELDVVGWKVYTPYGYGKDGGGWWLDDPKLGLPFLEEVRKSGRKIVFCHKGLPWPIWNREYTSPRDIGPAARLFPDVQIVCYHSGYDQELTEGPTQGGVDRLIESCRGRPDNVWAEIGGTWYVLMRKPVEATHVLGKLLKHFGEDRILWGSDAVFLGSPQAQLQAFRAFEIPVEMQEKYGYPALTPAIKAKILGLNAARLLGIDVKAKRHPIEDPLKGAELPPVHGPVTRRQYLRMWARRDWSP